jgi:hypothetical protein
MKIRSWTPPRLSQVKVLVPCHISFGVSLMLSAWMIQAFPLCAAENDEYIGEQMYDLSWEPEAEKSFWDPTFWRDLTLPIETPVVPGQGQWLYFGRKGADGTVFGEPARNIILYTAARLGLNPPLVPPSFSRVVFDQDEIVFNGTPDLPGAPLGQMIVAAPHPLVLSDGAKIDFDRTIVDANNTQIIGSELTFTGDVTSAGGTSNFISLGSVNVSRNGTQTAPSLRLRSGAISQLSSFSDSFTPALVPATSNVAVAIEGNAHFQASSVQLHNTAGKIFDASSGRGRVSLGSLLIHGNAPEVDPSVVFHATGAASPVSAFSVTNHTTMEGYRGVLAKIEDGASMHFNNTVYALSHGGKMGLRANRDGAIRMFDLSSTTVSTSGSTQLDWVATTQGSISLQEAMGTPLHLNDQAHVISALSGGKIDIPTSLGLDADGRLLFSASGAGSELRIDGTTQFTPHNYLVDPAARWSRISLNLANGGMLRGGETIDLGTGQFFADVRPVLVNLTASQSDVSVVGASMKNVDFSFSKASVNCEIGTVGSPAVLNQVSMNLGDGSLFVMRGSSWQPERVEMSTAFQLLQVGESSGSSVATFTDASVAHSLELRAGFGVFVGPGDPLPVVANSIVAIHGGSTVTGNLRVAQYPHGKGTVNISGSGTRCGFRNVQLGVQSNPIIGTQLDPLAPPSFTGDFFTSLGGQSSLNVTAGARLSIGSYEGAFGVWQRPDSFNPGFLCANATPITIDATSAIYLGNAANAGAQDFRNGALVVGPGGYLVGSGNIIGAAAGGNDLVNVGGSISPGFSPGTMTVDGNFLMESGTLVLEVKSGNPGDWDALVADAITITGGTIIIRPAAGYDSGAGIEVDFFQTGSLSIAPGVTVQVAPELGVATFDPVTGGISIVGGSEQDLNHNLIDDRIEAVLPAAGNSLEWGTFEQPVASAPVFQFRRKDSSLFTHTIVLQWSSDLKNWTDIPIPFSSFGEVSVSSNDSDPDLIKVTLPSPVGPNGRIFARLAVSSSSLVP